MLNQRKWRPAITSMIMLYAKTHKSFTPKQIAETHCVSQPQVSTSCLILLRERKLTREDCPCGNGFIYRRT